jgi:PKD repeat protein
MKLRWSSLLFLFILMTISLQNFGQLPTNNLTLWLRSDSGIVMNGTTVEQWLDQSGNGYHATQLTSGNQPLFIDSVILHYPALRFDGINDRLQLNFGGSTLQQPITVFCLWNTSSYGATKTAFDGINAGNRLLLSTLDNNIRVFSGANLNYPKVHPFDFILTSVVFQQNNTLIYENSVLKNNGNTGNNSLTGITLGAYYNGTFPLHGDIAEFILFDSLLTEPERLQIETYIMDKYAPPVDLGPDTIIDYSFCPFKIEIGSHFATVQWSNGSSSDTITVTESGIYWAEATDMFGRISYDTVSVDFPVFNITDTLICIGDTIYPSTGLGLNYNYLWSTNETTPQATVFSQGIYSVTVTDSLGCFRTDSFEVFTDDFASIVSLGNDTTLCSGNTIALISGQSEAVSYQWLPGNQTTPEIIVDTSGWYSVEVSNINNCYAKDSVFITITGTAPSINLNVQHHCFGDSTVFTDLSTPQASIAQQLWIFNMIDTLFGETVQYVFSDTGTFYVQHLVADTGGCVADTIFPVNILPSPQTHFTGNPPCTGLPVSFFGEAMIPSGTFVNLYQWHINGIPAGNDSTLTWTFFTSDTYSLSFTVSLDNGCSSTYQSNISVYDSYALPEVPLPIFPSNNITLADFEVEFTWNSSPGAIFYRIQIADDDNFSSVIADIDSISSTSIQLVLPDNGTYYWRIWACNPCNFCVESDTTQFIIFSPLSIPNLLLWLKADSGIEMNGNGVEQWLDQSGNNYHANQLLTIRQPILADSILNHLPVVRFDGVNDYLQSSFGDTLTQPFTLFCLWSTLSPGGTRTAFDGINANDRILLSTLIDQVRIFAGVNLNYFKPHPFHFTLNTAIINQNNSAIFENSLPMMNGNTGNNNLTGITLGAYYNGTFPLHGDIAEFIIFDSLLTEPERLQIETYLMDKYAPPVTLGDDIISQYSFCPVSLEVRPDYVSVLWSTGSTDDSITVNQTGHYWVQVVDVFDRMSSDTIYIQFPYFSLPDTLICLGDSAEYNSVLQGEYEYLWSDLSTDMIFHTAQAGQYWLQLTDTLGCHFADTFFVAVDSFSVFASLGPDLTLCSGESIGLISGNQPVDYLWSTSETNPDIIVQNAGEYSLTVTNINSCTAKDTINISLQGYKPLPGFLADSVCLGFPTGFTDISSSIAPEVIIHWEWTIDGNQFQQQHVQYQFPSPGNHAVQLYIETDSGCTASIIKDVYVRPNPQAAFMPITGCSEKPVQFTNLTTLPAGIIQGWEWQVTDTTQTVIAVSSNTHPVFTFPEAGIYTVRLIAVTMDGCRDTTFAQVEIRRTPPVDFIWQNTCLGQTTSFTETTQVPPNESIIQRIWDFGDTNSSTLPNPTHTYSNTGVYEVKLFNRALNGCQDTLKQLVEIHHLPVAGFSYSLPCLNTPVQFSDTSTVEGGTIESVMWTFPTGIISNLSQSLYLFPDTGSYHVSLIVTSNHGCENSTEETITVYPFPAAAFTFTPEYGVPPLIVTFTNESDGADTYLWNFGDDNTSLLPAPFNTYVQENVYTVSLIATNSYLCSDTAYGTVYVIPSTYDVAVTEAVQTEDGQYVRSEIFVKNLGTRNIRNLLMRLQTDDGTPVYEYWEGLLIPGEGTWFTFNSLLEKETLLKQKIVCFSAIPDEDVEDVNLQNNTVCLIISPGFYIISVSPNPAATALFVRFILRDDGPIGFDIISSDGKRMIEQFPIQGVQGMNMLQIDISTLNQGVYIMRIFNDNESDTEKVLIAR